MKNKYKIQIFLRIALTIIVCIVLIIISFSTTVLSISDVTAKNADERTTSVYKCNFQEPKLATETVDSTTFTKMEDDISAFIIEKKPHLPTDSRIGCFDNVDIAVQTMGDITTVTYHINDFIMKPITIDGEEYLRIVLEDESNMLSKGMPDLPNICRSIVIPDTAKMGVTVTSSQYDLYEGISVAPSKGNLLRTINPNDIPYEFNDIYKKDTWYPAQIAKLDKPYIIRDFRGQVVRIQPFQYNPIKKQLRFYTDITVEIYSKGVDEINCITRDNSPSMIDSDFKQIYEHHFINYDVRFGYTPVEEQGNMLIITYDDFWSTMKPFVQWKNTKGIPTEMINVSEIGNADDIKTFITDYYNNYDLTFVLLVGDAAQVPTLTANDYASDPSYSYVVGDDHYPDLFVGRFSAENTSQLETQVERTMEYEKYPEPPSERLRQPAELELMQGIGEKKYTATVPPHESGVTYYIHAEDYSGGSEYHPYIGASGAHSFTMNTSAPALPDYQTDSMDWYHKAMGIADEEGPSDDDEYDWEHMRNIRTDLLEYNYSEVDEMYEGSHGDGDAPGDPTSSMISAAINEGRSIINYCGHGNQISWRTGHFNNTNINDLTNDNMLPFIVSVACLNGDFVDTTCFAEAWLRATHDGEPTGAIATFMSSRSQMNDPPLDAQDEIVDILVGTYPDNRRFTFGGLVFNGCMHMNDEYGVSGYTETDAWHLFGDPSLKINPPIRGEHNIGVYELEVPGHVLPNETVYVNATIINDGLNNETDIIVSLLVNGVQINSTIIPFIESLGNEQVSFTLALPEVGIYEVTVNVTIPNVVEDHYEDNEQSQIIIVGIYNSDTRECFNYIQEALDDPDTLDGHSIIVPHGVYYENVMISKSISLTGEGRDTTIIDGNGSGDVVFVSADDVHITGFTLRNGTNGVSIQSSENIIINHNEICNNMLGVYVTDFSNNTEISYNNIHNNTRKISVIPNNITPNNISDLQSIPGNGISKQKIPLCFGGIKLENASNNTISKNDIINNYNGLKITSRSNHNLIYHNNFNNSQNAYDNGSENHWDNDYFDGPHIIGGNWWPDYNGCDEYSGPSQDETNPDGIGDTPYNISGISGSQDRYPLMEPWSGPLPSTIYVDDDNIMGPWDGTIEHPFQNIGDGIDTAIDNDTVFVFNGRYYENVLVDKSLNLIGEDRNSTIIDAGGVGDVVHISSDRVNISGFTIQNSGGCPTDAGINIISNYNTITGNTITNNPYGIYLHKFCYNNIICKSTIAYNGLGICQKYSYNTTIIRNMISNNDKGIMTTRSFNQYISNNSIVNNSIGIYLGMSSHNSVTENILSNDFISIWLYDINDIITNNTFMLTGINLVSGINSDPDPFLMYWNTHTIENNTANGRPIRYYKDMNGVVVPDDTAQVILANCTNMTIQGLNLSEMDIAIQLGFSSHNTVTMNTIANSSMAGILLMFSSNNSISGNMITDTNYYPSVFLLFSSNNIIFQNTIKDNSGGIFTVCQANNNTIYHNNFIDNTQNAYDECSNTWYNESLREGNYWSDYTDLYPDAEDANGDGIWDTSYDIPGGENQDLYPFVRENGWLYILGDLDFDGDVDLSDLAQLLAHYGMTSGATYEMGDIDGDGDVDLSDLAALLANYGTGT